MARGGSPKRLRAAAYRYAEAAPDDDGNPSPAPFEHTLLGYIDRFGVQAVMGRSVLSAGEIRRMVVCENILNAYRARANYRDRDGVLNYAEWASRYPDAAMLLAEAVLLESEDDAD